MAKKASSASKRSKETVSTESREAIEAQIQAFLASGGEIEQVPKGVSGQTNTSGPKHITLGKKPRA